MQVRAALVVSSASPPPGPGRGNPLRAPPGRRGPPRRAPARGGGGARGRGGHPARAEDGRGDGSRPGLGLEPVGHGRVRELDRDATRFTSWTRDGGRTWSEPQEIGNALLLRDGAAAPGQPLPAAAPALQLPADGPALPRAVQDHRAAGMAAGDRRPRGRGAELLPPQRAHRPHGSRARGRGGEARVRGARGAVPSRLPRGARAARVGPRQLGRVGSRAAARPRHGLRVGAGGQGADPGRGPRPGRDPRRLGARAATSSSCGRARPRSCASPPTTR